jgi:hypothetical protein
LKDAAAVRDTAQRDGWLNDASTESIVAGLCRAALDGAIRQATINRAVRYGIVVDAALVALGEVRETGARVGHVLGLVGGQRTSADHAAVRAAVPARMERRHPRRTRSGAGPQGPGPDGPPGLCRAGSGTGGER